MTTTEPVDEAREALPLEHDVRCRYFRKDGKPYEAHVESVACSCDAFDTLAAFEQTVRADAIRIPEDSEFAGATPGPRVAGPCPGHDRFYVDGPDGRYLGEFIAEADARLDAAAPALLARVRKLEALMFQRTDELNAAAAEIGRLREALAGLLAEAEGPETPDIVDALERARAALGEHQQ